MATEHGGCPVVGFDHNSAEHSADPVEVYRRLRAEAPVAWTEAHGGYWVVSDYTGVFDAARDDSTFASGRSEHGGTGLNNVIPKAPVRLHIPVELDLPEHRSYRKVINPLTSPAAVERMQPMIERWTTAFVDDVIEDGDLRPRLASSAYRRSSPSTGSDSTSTTGGGTRAPCTRSWPTGSAARSTRTPSRWTSPGWSSTITAAIAERRREPRDDVISILLEAEVDGQPITDDAVYSIVELLISGGVGTTASLVSQTLVHLYRAPRPADSSGREPRAARPGGRGVPPRLLADPGAGPHRHPRRRLPWLPHAGGRPRPPRVVVREPRPRPVRTSRRGGPRPLAEPAHRLRHGHPPLRRRAHRSGHRPRADPAGHHAGCPTTSSTSTASRPTRTRASTPGSSGSPRRSRPAAGWARDRRRGRLGAADRPRDPGGARPRARVSTSPTSPPPVESARSWPPAPPPATCRRRPCGRRSVAYRVGPTASPTSWSACTSPPSGRRRRVRRCSGCTAAATCSAAAAQDDPLLQDLVARTGCVAVAVDWRRAPEDPYPAAVHDAYAALRWMAAGPGAGPGAAGRRRRELGRGSRGRPRPAGPRPGARCALAGQVLVYPMLDDREVTASSREVLDPRLWNHESNRLGWAAYLSGLDGEEVPRLRRTRPSDRPQRAAADLARDRRARPLPRRGRRVCVAPARRGSAHRAARVPRAPCTASTSSPRRPRVSRRYRRDRDEAFDRFVGVVPAGSPEARGNESATGFREVLASALRSL